MQRARLLIKLLSLLSVLWFLMSCDNLDFNKIPPNEDIPDVVITIPVKDIAWHTGYFDSYTWCYHWWDYYGNDYYSYGGGHDCYDDDIQVGHNSDYEQGEFCELHTEHDYTGIVFFDLQDIETPFNPDMIKDCFVTMFLKYPIDIPCTISVFRCDTYITPDYQQIVDGPKTLINQIDLDKSDDRLCFSLDLAVIKDALSQGFLTLALEYDNWFLYHTFYGHSSPIYRPFLELRLSEEPKLLSLNTN